MIHLSHFIRKACAPFLAPALLFAWVPFFAQAKMGGGDKLKQNPMFSMHVERYFVYAISVCNVEYLVNNVMALYDRGCCGQELVYDCVSSPVRTFCAS